MSKLKKILVFTATYNEKSNIGDLIKSIFENCPDSNILIIDDNSPDKTADVIEDIKKNSQNLFLIKREKKSLYTNIENQKIIWAKNFGVPFRSNIKIIDNLIFLSNQD